MHFRREQELKHQLVDHRSLPRTFTVNGRHDHVVSVTIRPPEGEQPPPDAPARCDAIMGCTPGRRAASDFAALASGRLPEGNTLDPAKHGNAPWFCEAEGTVKWAPYEILPQRLQELTLKVLKELEEAVDRTLSTLRWRTADSGPRQPLTGSTTWWTLDGERWRPLLAPYDGGGYVYGVPSISEAIRSDVQRYLNDGVQAPLAHEIWREAWELHTANPRSSLLIGISALEVGVKQHIAELVPSAGGLLEHVQSPPVEKLLGEYLPTLHPFPLSKEVLKEIRNAVALRNLVAHKGSTDVDPTRLRAMLQTVRTVLQVLDSCRGYTWQPSTAQRARVEPRRWT